jgi:hypothetical protein
VIEIGQLLGYNERTKFMLTPYRPQFVEKILADSFGRQFRVVFAVSYSLDGEVRGRIVSAQPIELLKGSTIRSHANACLPCAQSFNLQSFNLPIVTPVASPYFSLEYLLNSQPTRAPAVA